MPVGSGLGSQVGFSTESSWGTRVAPTKFLRASSFSLNREANRVQGEGIQSGVLGQQGAHYVETTEAATGSLTFDVPPVGIGQLLQALMGGASTAVQQAASAAYLHTHTLSDNLKSLTVQGNVPYRGGTAYCEEITGAKVTSAEFSCAVNEMLTCTLNLDGKKWDNTQTLATASYTAQPAMPVFHGKQLTVKTGTFGSESAVNGVVKSVSCSITNEMDAEDYTAGSSGLKSEQIRNGFVAITGTISTDWTTGTKSAFEDLRVANTSTSLVLDFTSTTAIASTYYWRFTITLPGVFFNGDSPSVQGPDVVTVDYGYEWKYDGTNVPKIEVMTTDTAV